MGKEDEPKQSFSPPEREASSRVDYWLNFANIVENSNLPPFLKALFIWSFKLKAGRIVEEWQLRDQEEKGGKSPTVDK